MTSQEPDLTTKAACLEVLRLYQNWNVGQKSSEKVFHGGRGNADEVYDARRALIFRATQTLERLIAEEAGDD